MKYEAILYEKHGAVSKVITNGPRYKNAQSRLMIEEMDHAFSAANADEDVRVIVLVAAATPSRPDTTSVLRKEKRTGGVRFLRECEASIHSRRLLFLDTTLGWRDLDKPTIAQV